MLAARVGVLAGQPHRRLVPVADLDRPARVRRSELACRRVGERQKRRHGVHRLAGDLAGVEVAPGREIEKAGRDAVTEAAASEMAGDPERSVGGLDQEVDVVVAGADRPQLLLRARAQRPRPLSAANLLGQLRHLVPRRRLEERVVDRSRILAPHAEADPAGDLVGQPGQVGADVVERDRRPHRHDAAADVVAHPARRHHVAVGGDAADRHRVAEVVVGHERRLGHPAVPGDGADLLHRLRIEGVAEHADPAPVQLAVGLMLDDHRTVGHSPMLAQPAGQAPCAGILLDATVRPRAPRAARRRALLSLELVACARAARGTRRG